MAGSAAAIEGGASSCDSKKKSNAEKSRAVSPWDTPFSKAVGPISFRGDEKAKMKGVKPQIYDMSSEGLDLKGQSLAQES